MSRNNPSVTRQRAQRLALAAQLLHRPPCVDCTAAAPST